MFEPHLNYLETLILKNSLMVNWRWAKKKNNTEMKKTYSNIEMVNKILLHPHPHYSRVSCGNQLLSLILVFCLFYSY